MSSNTLTETPALQAILTRGRAAVRRGLRELELWQAARALGALDDRQLADFGMRRGAIEEAVRHGRGAVPMVAQ
jgi:uncharacterized protein YjiS (DUF1127 family)